MFKTITSNNDIFVPSYVKKLSYPYFSNVVNNAEISLEFIINPIGGDDEDKENEKDIYYSFYIYKTENKKEELVSSFLFKFKGNTILKKTISVSSSLPCEYTFAHNATHRIDIKVGSTISVKNTYEKSTIWDNWV